MNRESILKDAAKAGIKVRPAKRQKPSFTELFRALRVGEELTTTFSHKQAPYSFARAAGVRVRTQFLGQAGKRVRIRVERIAA